MPRYDYGCKSCETVTEVTHSMTDEGPFLCDECGSEMNKVYTPAPIHFKGVGFYANDKTGPFIWGDKANE